MANTTGYENKTEMQRNLSKKNALAINQSKDDILIQGRIIYNIQKEKQNKVNILEFVSLKFHNSAWFVINTLTHFLR